MKKEYIILKEGVKVENTRFLLALNKEEHELYVLHREFPRCLIYVEQTTPLNFIVVDFFETEEDQETSIEFLLSDQFKSDLKNYVAEQSLSDELN